MTKKFAQPNHRGHHATSFRCEICNYITYIKHLENIIQYFDSIYELFLHGWCKDYVAVINLFISCSYFQISTVHEKKNCFTTTRSLTWDFPLQPTKGTSLLDYSHLKQMNKKETNVNFFYGGEKIMYLSIRNTEYPKQFRIKLCCCLWFFWPCLVFHQF